MAIRLDKAFGGGASMWCRMQAAYNLAQAMKRAGKIEVERIERALPQPKFYTMRNHREVPCAHLCLHDTQ